MKPRPVILIDTREQEPLTFGNLRTEQATLDAGDYSIFEMSQLIAVERKSLPDLLACVGRERERFKRELQRLRAYRFRLLIIEADAAALEAGGWRSQLTPQHVLGSLAPWVAQYSLSVWLAGDHDSAGRFVERFLYQAARSVTTEYAAAESAIESWRCSGAAPAGCGDPKMSLGNELETAGIGQCNRSRPRRAGLVRPRAGVLSVAQASQGGRQRTLCRWVVVFFFGRRKTVASFDGFSGAEILPRWEGFPLDTGPPDRR